MSQFIDAVRAVFDEEGWDFTQEDERTIFKMPYSGENGPWTCYVHVREEDGQVLCYSILNALVPPASRAAVMEFCARVNYAIAVGSLEINPQDGEVRFRTSIDFGESLCQMDLLRQMFYINLTSMDMFLPGIIEIVNKQAAPASVLARIQAAL